MEDKPITYNIYERKNIVRDLLLKVSKMSLLSEFSAFQLQKCHLDSLEENVKIPWGQAI